MKLLQFKHKVRNTNRLASMGSEESEESARELHEQQKKLVLEEDNVRNVDTKLGRMQKKRSNREGENGRFVLLVVFYKDIRHWLVLYVKISKRLIFYTENKQNGQLIFSLNIGHFDQKTKTKKWNKPDNIIISQKNYQMLFVWPSA